MNALRIFVAIAITLLSVSAFSIDEFKSKTITKIYTYASTDKVVFSFEPTEPNSCIRTGHALIDTSTAAGKQTFSALMTAKALNATIDFRGTTGNCSEFWSDSMISIYRLDF